MSDPDMIELICSRSKEPWAQLASSWMRGERRGGRGTRYLRDAQKFPTNISAVHVTGEYARPRSECIASSSGHPPTSCSRTTAVTTTVQAHEPSGPSHLCCISP